LAEGRGQPLDKTVNKDVGKDAERYRVYEISSVVFQFEEGKDREIEGCSGNNERKKGRQYLHGYKVA
jgi:hypothetical protein